MKVWEKTRGCLSTDLLGTVDAVPCVTVPDTVTINDGGWFPIAQK